MVNLEWYRTFKAIYQNGNLTRAAEELFISQPNVSIQLASLESYIGHKLFVRQPRKLVATEYGKMLYTQIVESVENLERVEAEFRKVALKRVGNLRVGSPIEYVYNNLLDRLGECKSDTYFKFGMAKDLIADLENKELDFVIATQKIDKAGIEYEFIQDENFMIVCAVDRDTSPFDAYIQAEQYPEAEKYLLKQSWIAYDNKLSLIRRFWKENFAKRPLLKPHIIAPDINTILKSVSLGYGMTVVSDMLAEPFLKQDMIKVLWKGTVVAKNTIWLAYNPLRVEEYQIEEVRELLGIVKQIGEK